MAPIDRPGPKRNDPLRIAALRANGLKQMELKRIAEEQVRAARVGIGDRVRVVIKGNQTLQGKVVGEDMVDKTSCWLVETTKGTRFYAKGHCQWIGAKEVSKALRHLKNKPKPDKDIYGDGDI